MERIGRYELRDKLGQGGMGVVYRAYDTLLQRVVAVKLISGQLEGNPDLRERFFREARAAGQLSHRNIITIHDLGEHEGMPYLAMEYLDGEDLQRRMAGHDRMSLAHKLDLAIEICEGLEFAHTHSVIHRDIKPANIFITDHGRVKLLDFGLARLVTSELTHSNMMMGTINYMAPEQVRGERADHRSDIFATGVVLYELLCGKKAFQGDSFAATLYQILQQVPEPLDRIDPSIPWQIIAVVDRALAKPRDERYQSMGDMLRDLMTVRQQQQLSDSPTGYRSAFASGPLSPVPQPAPGPGSGPSALRPGSGGGRLGSHPEGMGMTTPAPLLTPGPTTPVPVPQPTGLRIALIVAAIVAALAVGAFVYRSLTTAPPPPAAAQPTPAAPITPERDTRALDAVLAQAQTALQAGNYPEATRLADSVLQQSPDNADAKRIADHARDAAQTIDRGLRDARAYVLAGRFDEAAQAAGNVLGVAPANEEAKRLMAEATSRSRGRAVDEARTRSAQARSSAVSAGAPTLAANIYASATAAERDAARLQKAGRASEASAKYYEAGGLFRSAEVAAQTAAAAARQRAEAAERTPPAAAPQPQVQATPAPSPPVTPIDRTPGTSTVPLPTPTTTPVAPPVTPPPAPAPAPAPAAPAPPSPEVQIREVIRNYEQALEGRNMEALKRIWPGLGGSQQGAIRNEFDHASRIDVDITDPHITVSGTSATATFVRHYEMQTTDRQVRRADSPTTMTLRRTDTGWVIEQIRFDAAR
jgi:serine/threonine-protein kinase